MKNLYKSLFAVLLGIVTFMSYGVAEEANADKQAIIDACTAESKGAIDVQEYIDMCVKDKLEELKAEAEEQGKEQG